MIRSNKNYFSLALLFIALLAIYSPVLTHKYFFHDDVNFFTRTPSRIMPPSQLFNFFVGRYLGAVAMTIASWRVHFMDDLRWLRLFAILNVAITSFILYRFLRDYFQNKIHSFLAVILVTTLPGIQIIVSYAGIFFHSMALSLSSIAAYMVLKMPTTSRLPARLTDKFAILAMFLQFLAISTYTPTAMFFWVFVLIVLLSSVHKPSFDLKVKLLNFYFVGFIALAIYGFILKLIQNFSSHYISGMYNPYQIDFNLFKKLQWFVKEPLLNILNLWGVFPSYEWAVSLLSFILISAIVHIVFIYNQRKERFDVARTSVNTVVLTIVLASLILLSFLPSLMASGEAPFYRCTFNLAAMMVLLLVWSLDNWLNWVTPKMKSYILTFVLILLCFYATFRAYNNIFFLRILPSEIEFQYLMENTEKADLNDYKRVHIIRPDPWILPERYDEFVTPTSRYDQDAIGMLTTALIEKSKNVLDIKYLRFDPLTSDIYYVFSRRKDQKNLPYKIKISSSFKSDLPVFNEKTLLIDFNQLYYPQGKLHYLTR